MVIIFHDLTSPQFIMASIELLETRGEDCGSSQEKSVSPDLRQSVEDVIEKIQERLSLRGICIMVLIMTVHLSSIFSIQFPVYGGFIPYTEWKCVEGSGRCEARVRAFSWANPGASSPFNRKVLCGTEGEPALQIGVDFMWDVAKNRTSYAVDWGLYCATEYKATLLSSLYFVGAVIGLFTGNFFYDTFGRRRVCMIGYLVEGFFMMASAAAPNLSTLMALRVFGGIGTYLGLSGMYVYVLECTAIKWRAFISSMLAVMWGVGMLAFAPTLSYFITNWRILSVAGGACMMLTVSTWFLVPPSPRHLMENQGDQKGAVRSLKRFAWIFRASDRVDFNSLKLKSSQNCKKEMSYLHSLRDFLNYNELLIQLLIQVFQWMIVAFLYFGFTFGWSKLGSNMYLSYVFAGIAEIVAALGCWFGQDVLGRKLTMISCFFVAGSSFLLALIPLSFGTDILTMEQLMCLIGSMFVAGAWGTLYLYVTEQSPTPHRGKMAAICSIGARLGSFAGPQASLLFNVDKSGALVLFAVLAFAAGLASLRLPETKGLQSPNNAEEVQFRRQRLIEMRNGNIFKGCFT